jgi:hypothetical protein
MLMGLDEVSALFTLVDKNDIWVVLLCICVLSQISSLILEEAHATADGVSLGLVVERQRFTAVDTFDA